MFGQLKKYAVYLKGSKNNGKSLLSNYLSRLLIINPATSYSPTPERCSTIGSSRLNFRVRDGNGCDPTDNITGKLIKIYKSVITIEFMKTTSCNQKFNICKQANNMVKPWDNQYWSTKHITVLTSPTYQRGGLPRVSLAELILGLASRLDAFSVYPCSTQLPCATAGAITRTLEVDPSRSSRTKDRFLQFCCAHTRQGPNCLATF